MTRNELKELVKQVVAEETEYQKLFKTMLDRSGKDINSMNDDEKKKFFTAVDKAYKAKSENKLIDSKKTNLNESFITGLLSWMLVLGVIKLIGILFTRLAVSAVDYFQTASNVVKKENIANIFGKISSNDQFINDVAELINNKKNLDKTTANKIVKMSFVQSLIDREIRDADIDKKYKKDFENSVAETLLNAWNDPNMMKNIVSKVKNDIK